MTTRVLPGLKPTGQLHLGNYLGAIRPLMELAAEPDNDVVVSVVDLHALTVDHDPATVRTLTVEMAATLLACGAPPADDAVRAVERPGTHRTGVPHRVHGHVRR